MIAPSGFFTDEASICSFSEGGGEKKKKKKVSRCQNATPRFTTTSSETLS